MTLVKKRQQRRKWKAREVTERPRGGGGPLGRPEHLRGGIGPVGRPAERHQGGGGPAGRRIAIAKLHAFHERIHRLSSTRGPP